MSAEPTRLFTLNEANATLPLVRAITQDLAESSFEVFERHQQFNRVMAGRDMEEGSPYCDEMVQVRQDLEQQAERLQEYLEELKQLGVEPRNGPQGIIDTVDFPSEREERGIYLCWQLGEDEITHWHKLEAGFAGRQQLFATVAIDEENSPC
jgi:hypothetical protein